MSTVQLIHKQHAFVKYNIYILHNTYIIYLYTPLTHNKHTIYQVISVNESIANLALLGYENTKQL